MNDVKGRLLLLPLLGFYKGEVGGKGLGGET